MCGRVGLRAARYARAASDARAGSSDARWRAALPAVRGRREGSDAWLTRGFDRRHNVRQREHDDGGKNVAAVKKQILTDRAVRGIVALGRVCWRSWRSVGKGGQAPGVACRKGMDVAADDVALQRKHEYRERDRKPLQAAWAGNFHPNGWSRARTHFRP